MQDLKNYRKVAGSDVVDQIYREVDKISHKHALFVNSTYQGGGVAELLNTLVPLFNEAGLELGWRILHGNADFFNVTKKFHNGLQGEKIRLSEAKKKVYLENNKRYASFTHIEHDRVDLVVVHDPQPLPLIKFYKKTQPWAWRCHIDLSAPSTNIWKYLKPYINKYDHMVISKNDYVRKDLNIPQSVIAPAIDPLSIKNMYFPEQKVDQILKKHGIDLNKPIVSQISRFDKWKDPVGVVKIFEDVRKKVDCQLVLLGNLAVDDPEGQMIYENVKKAVEKSKYQNDIKMILLDSDILVNCMQRASDVVIQKSTKEGFGLTVSEALYKGTPVVASSIGGIPLQVSNGVNGFLHKPDDLNCFSKSVVKLLNDKKMRADFGRQGHEFVKKNYLITRLMLDWTNFFKSNFKK